LRAAWTDRACAPEGPAAVTVAQELLEYLNEHPGAADTLEGIMSWWLPRQRYEREVRNIEQGLEELVAQGVVRKDRLIDGTVLYSRVQHSHRPCPD